MFDTTLHADVQVLEEVPDLLAPKPGQQQQQALPQYPHPALATLFAAKPQKASKASYGSDATAGAAGNSSGLISAAASEERLARTGSPGLTSVLQAQAQPRQARGSDPTDSMMRSELFAGSPSPRAAGSMDSTRPGSGSAGARGRGAAAPAAAAAAVGGLAGAGGAPRVRTADEIRQAYGRTAANKTQVGLSSAGVMTGCAGLLAVSTPACAISRSQSK